MNARYEATTAGINVSVQVFYLAAQSHPAAGRFVWAYNIRLTNGGADTVQLLRRSWEITDATGNTQLVHGPGVIGQTPILAPGESFEYTSGTPLPTESGFMTGKYHMLNLATGVEFTIAIPAFSLDSPTENSRRH
ncbi:MAG: Co2+/Mg2+ efflux protein ApaG [Acidocella sp.]|nr:Co2+/Mg2+ efflux protein ApaG [Acidocella sp.]